MAIIPCFRVQELIFPIFEDKTLFGSYQHFGLTEGEGSKGEANYNTQQLFGCWVYRVVLVRFFECWVL